jgi:hypothetical protein
MAQVVPLPELSQKVARPCHAKHVKDLTIHSSGRAARAAKFKR